MRIQFPGSDVIIDNWSVTTGNPVVEGEPYTAHDIAVTLGIVGGAIALPVLAGGGIGIAMAGSAFGIGVETLAIGGAIAGGVAGHNLTKDVLSEELTPEDEYSDNEADLAYLRNGDF